MQTKRWEKSGETEELRKLYRYVIELFMNMDLSGYDEKYIQSLVEKYRDLHPEIKKEELILPELQKALFEIDYYIIHPKFKGAVKSKKLKELKIVCRRCVALEKNGHEDRELFYWSLYFLGMYHNKISGEADSAIQHMKRLEEETRGRKDHHSERFFRRAKLVLCMIYLHGSQFEESYQVFKEVFEMDPMLIKKGPYYADHFMRLCIALNKLEEAEEILTKAFPVKEHDAHEDFSDEYAIWALIEMLTGRMESAFTHILWAKQGLQKNYFFHLDSMTRIIEQGYFVLNKDYELARDAAEKNTKFFDYHKEKEDAAIFKLVPGFMQACVDFHFEGKTVSKKYLNTMVAMQQGTKGFLGQLLKTIAEEFGVPQSEK
jgi:tetratricopeptide (TPR) repeat protein